MRTVQMTVYRFHELSRGAKDRAKNDYQTIFDFNNAQDYLASIQKLAEHFGGRLVDYEVDWFNSSPCSPPTFDMPDMDRDEIEERLNRLGSFDPKTLMGHGDCKLTGYFADESAIDGFRRKFMGGESDLNELMQAAYDSWLKAAQEDCNDCYSDETFGETCEANDYEFYSNGKMFH